MLHPNKFQLAMSGSLRWSSCTNVHLPAAHRGGSVPPRSCVGRVSRPIRDKYRVEAKSPRCLKGFLVSGSQANVSLAAGVRCLLTTVGFLRGPSHRLRRIPSCRWFRHCRYRPAQSSRCKERRLPVLAYRRLALPCSKPRCTGQASELPRGGLRSSYLRFLGRRHILCQQAMPRRSTLLVSFFFSLRSFWLPPSPITHSHGTRR